MYWLFLVAGCASDAPEWAVHHASLIPSETGLSGTQTWEFFSPAWARSGDPDAFVCARAQLVTGAVTAALPGCEGCTVAYTIDVAELESDCAAPLDTDTAYTTPRAIGLGDVPDALADLDPYPGRSLGWYLSVDGVEMEAYGFAYDEALDWAGDLGAPGWSTGQAYTLWPAYAWDLRD
ncbi:MAG: hypothetical protein Q8P18_16585 [Pseudomonadota bacterium]|nr:hypothetical protein [Pseudomonadota bacterium]